MYIHIHGRKVKKKKKNSRFPTGCFTFHGSIGAKSRSVRDRPWFKRNTDLTLPGYARSACVLRGLVLKTHSCILSGSVFTHIRVHARTPADINCRCIYICARHLERLPCHAIFHDPATPRRMTNHYLCFPSALSPDTHFPYEMISYHSPWSSHASRSQRFPEFDVLFCVWIDSWAWRRTLFFFFFFLRLGFFFFFFWFVFVDLIPVFSFEFWIFEEDCEFDKANLLGGKKGNWNNDVRWRNCYNWFAFEINQDTCNFFDFDLSIFFIVKIIYK